MDTLTIVLAVLTVILLVFLIATIKYYRNKFSRFFLLQTNLQLELIDLVRNYLFKQDCLDELDAMLQIKRKSLRDVQSFILSNGKKNENSK